MRKSLGKLEVNWAELKKGYREKADLVICGSGKKVTLELDRGSVGYLFGFLAKYLKDEESRTAQLRREMALENQP